MTNDSAARIHIPGILLVAAFAIGLGFYLFMPPQRVARTLFFPGVASAELSGERRLIPRTESIERSVYLLVQDLLLGPTSITHRRALPRATAIRSLMVEDRVAYLDLGAEAILAGTDVAGAAETGFEAVRKSILFNFRQLDEVVITLDGHVPFVPAYRPGGS